MNSITFLILRRLRRPLLLLLTVYSIAVLGFTLIPGIDDNGNPWRMDFFHAFYFVSYMGSTIGFGELPYPFTDAQRMWTMVTIYTTVVSWLYTIGSIISLIQDPTLRDTLLLKNFEKTVSRIKEPFYLVCGYGETGNQLVRAMCRRGLRSVVIDANEDRINALQLQDHGIYVPGITGDATNLEILKDAGLKNRFCKGIFALTDNDLVNLKVSITSKLLNPDVKVIARVEHHEIDANMKSFGTDHIINPFDSFADLVTLAIKAPSFYLLQTWLTSPPGTELIEPVSPPKGRWVICGYGRFGHAMHKQLGNLGIEVTVVDANPDVTNPPKHFVFGAGTEAVTLREAEVETATALVAANDNDTNNLSTIMTARELNPDLFLVSRQNGSANDELFQAANMDMITYHNRVVARRTLAIITTPLTEEFLKLARKQEISWANQLVSRIIAVTGDEVPHTWVINVKAGSAKAIMRSLKEKRPVHLRHFLKDPSNRKSNLDCVALMIKRDNKTILTPDAKETIRAGDSILFSGTGESEISMRRIARNYEDLFYIRTGVTRPSGHIWRKLFVEKENF